MASTAPIQLGFQLPALTSASASTSPTGRQSDRRHRIRARFWPDRQRQRAPRSSSQPQQLNGAGDRVIRTFGLTGRARSRTAPRGPRTGGCSRSRSRTPRKSRKASAIYLIRLKRQDRPPAHPAQARRREPGLGAERQAHRFQLLLRRAVGVGALHDPPRRHGDAPAPQRAQEQLRIRSGLVARRWADRIRPHFEDDAAPHLVDRGRRQERTPGDSREPGGSVTDWGTPPA